MLNMSLLICSGLSHECSSCSFIPIALLYVVKPTVFRSILAIQDIETEFYGARGQGIFRG